MKKNKKCTRLYNNISKKNLERDNKGAKNLVCHSQ